MNSQAADTEISLALARARMEAGLSQEDLASRLGVTTVTVKQAEQGMAFPRASYIMQVAEATGVSITFVGDEVLVRKNSAAKTWRTFQEAGLLWWVNRILHTFGWSIVLTENDEGRILDARPERTSWRGFPPDVEEDGYEKVAAYLAGNADNLSSEARTWDDRELDSKLPF